MSEDQGSKKNGEWQMPDPVFRSSDGFDPRERLKADDVPTESPDKDDTAEMDIEYGYDTPAETPAAEEYEAARAEPPAGAQAGGCFKTVGMIGAVLSVLAVLIVGALIYFLFFYQPAQTTF